MAQVLVFAGLQAAEGVRAASLTDLGATDFNLEENVSTITSEVFQNVQAAGDSAVSKIEVSGGVPIELSAKTFELLLPGLSYKGDGGEFKMSKDKPSLYTIVLEDSENNQTFTYIDCVLNTFNINVAMGAYITSDLEFIGRNVEIAEGAVANPVDRGASLRALFSTVTLDGTDITEDVESMDITVNNGMEARGAINSLYNVKSRRSTPQTTEVTIEKNEYDPSDYSALRAKMLAGTPATVSLTVGDGEKSITVDVLRGQISQNSRGDWKGAGSHSIAMNCSAANEDNSHLKVTFPTSTFSLFQSYED